LERGAKKSGSVPLTPLDFKKGMLIFLLNLKFYKNFRGRRWSYED